MNERVVMAVLAVYCLTFSLMFVIRLGRRKFWETDAGKSAMVMGSVVTATMALAAYRRIFSDVPRPLWIAAFLLIAGALTYQFYALEKTQRAGDRAERRRREREELRR